MTFSMKDSVKVLNQLKNNYRKSFADMSVEDMNNTLDIWASGLQRIEPEYVWKALDYYMYESTDSFAPTIGQFLHKANEYKEEYERKHPVIRSAYEVNDVSN